jgi:hypothetical protein
MKEKTQAAVSSTVGRLVGHSHKPHCGACGKQFDTAKDLIEHIKGCAAARLGTAFIEKAVAAGLEPSAQMPNSAICLNGKDQA